eukprot:52409_1
MMPNHVRMWEEDCTLSIQIHLSWLGSMIIAAFALFVMPVMSLGVKARIALKDTGVTLTQDQLKMETTKGASQDEKMFWLGASLILGFMLTSIAVTVIRASITTMLVMIIQCPEQICEAHPEIHAKLKHAWDRHFGNDAWARLLAGRAVAAKRAAAKKIAV